jgi:hypothetical protein
MSEALAFQKQISDLKESLEELARENVEAKLSLSELSLKTEELNICTADLAKVTKFRLRCEKWADELDTEKSNKTIELNEASEKLAEERQLVVDAVRRAEETARRLKEARVSLTRIEGQKNATVERLQKELQASRASARRTHRGQQAGRAPCVRHPFRQSLRPAHAFHLLLPPPPC